MQPPRVDGNGVEFRWSVTPSTPLHTRTSFRLDFPREVDAATVPEALWWRVGLICLYQHWTLLRPCRVVLPVRLAPGEREAWLRLCDTSVWTLEARRLDGARDTRRSIDLVESGPALPPLAPPAATSDVTVACFSGGRDSLAQLGMLRELGRPTVLVTTTSPLPYLADHTAAGRTRAMEEVVRRCDVELVDVRSDYRDGLDHGFAWDRYGVSVNELTDCLLYFAAALVVAYARGSRLVVLAAEAENQGSTREDGRIVQHHFNMYSAVTQRALTALLAPTGIDYAGLTAPLRQFQLQRVLSERYEDLGDLQFSCFRLGVDEQACSACFKCATNALNLLQVGIAPRVIGIDATRLIGAADVWLPEGGPIDPRTHAGLLSLGSRLEQLHRSLHAVTPERMAAHAEADAVAAYAKLRAQTLRGVGLIPEPGYAAAFLALVPEEVRDGIRTIAEASFRPQDDGVDDAALRRSSALSGWVTAPLRDPALDRRRARRGASGVCGRAA